jgi:hypothetical protein
MISVYEILTASNLSGYPLAHVRMPIQPSSSRLLSSLGLVGR